MKNSNDTIGNRTRDLPACSAVPQPTAQSRDPPEELLVYKEGPIAFRRLFSQFYRLILNHFPVFGVAEAPDKLGSAPHRSAAQPSAPRPYSIWQSTGAAIALREAQPLSCPAQDTPSRALQRPDLCHLWALLEHTAQFTSLNSTTRGYKATNDLNSSAYCRYNEAQH